MYDTQTKVPYAITFTSPTAVTKAEVERLYRAANLKEGGPYKLELLPSESDRSKYDKVRVTPLVVKSQLAHRG